MLVLNDHEGNRETLYYNPTVQIYDDGSIIIEPTSIWVKGKEYKMPMYAGDGNEIWADFISSAYCSNIKDCADNAFLAISRKLGVYTITRYRNPKGMFSKLFAFIASLVRFRHEIS